MPEFELRECLIGCGLRSVNEWEIIGREDLRALGMGFHVVLV